MNLALYCDLGQHTEARTFMNKSSPGTLPAGRGPHGTWMPIQPRGTSGNHRELEEAFRVCQDVVDGYALAYGAEHAETVDAKGMLERIQRAME